MSTSPNLNFKFSTDSTRTDPLGWSKYLLYETIYRKFTQKEDFSKMHLLCPREVCHPKLEQIHWNQLFCGMYGLAVMLSFSTRTTSKNIDEISRDNRDKFQKNALRKVSCFWLIIKTFIYLLQLKLLLNTYSMSNAIHTFTFFRIWLNRRRPFNLHLLKIKVLRNKGLFQTLEKFQVLQTLISFQVWHLDFFRFMV